MDEDMKQKVADLAYNHALDLKEPKFMAELEQLLGIEF